MTVPQSTKLPDHERRRHPRYFVTSRMTLAVEDESLKESLGLGEPSDISLGGIRVRNLPACPEVRVGDQLGLLLIDPEDALTLHGEVVHHSTPETFGVRFDQLSPSDQKAVTGMIERLHSRL
jgi:c-di-GMP-binding flagellar brake protein YcgR